MEKWRVLVGLILMLSMGSAVCSRLIAVWAPDGVLQNTYVSSTNCVGGWGKLIPLGSFA